MIYLFTWNNSFLIQQEGLKWKRAFSDKFSPENIIHITSLDSISKDTLSEAFFARSLFSDKRMVIIEWFPFTWEKQFAWSADIENFILSSLSNAGDEIFIVFLSENPDKRKIGYKSLASMAEVKQFSLSSDEDVSGFLRKKFTSQIDWNALSKIIYLKGWNLQKSISEITKLLILHEHISLTLVNENIIPEFEQSIFVFIDTLLAKDKINIFKQLDNMLQFSDFYAVYQSILANIRIFLYIEYLKSQRKSSKEISEILKLWKRQFLIHKSHASKFNDIQLLYEKLLNFDKNMKFGKLYSSDTLNLKHELRDICIKYV